MVFGERFMGHKRSLVKGFWDPRNGFWGKIYGAKMVSGERILGSKKQFLGKGLWDPERVS
ncbi:hypothetical protein CASFOL_007600 [Castilleja foliolosa]|uniref:Uncharacterized protein n=1 Tax=Castilleja foliolosa TaxID=1961234 RepID=A0ABD3E530_9LAMI